MKTNSILEQLYGLLHTTEEIITLVPSSLMTGELAELQRNHGSISGKTRDFLLSTALRLVVGLTQPLV
jgi:hypothetical protein